MPLNVVYNLTCILKEGDFYLLFVVHCWCNFSTTAFQNGRYKYKTYVQTGLCQFSSWANRVNNMFWRRKQKPKSRLLSALHFSVYEFFSRIFLFWIEFLLTSFAFAETCPDFMELKQNENNACLELSWELKVDYSNEGDTSEIQWEIKRFIINIKSHSPVLEFICKFIEEGYESPKQWRDTSFEEKSSNASNFSLKKPR